MSIDVEALNEQAERTRFAGVVAVLGGETDVLLPYGVANRSTGTPITADTAFATASGSKTMTALVIVSLIEEGLLTFDTPARTLLGEDLPLIDDAVTIRHLLTHTSGIGDYLDEEADDYDPDGYLMSRPVHTYLTASDFLGDLDGHPQISPPGQQFIYCNGSFLVLALLAERASGGDYHQLVRERVLVPAGMERSGFFRSDRLPPQTAIGYLSPDDDAISHILHLPVLGGGDGGMYTTAGDTHRFWSALLSGAILPMETVEDMISVHAEIPDEPVDYGLGFWLRPEPNGEINPSISGEDAGASFISRHFRSEGLTRTVLSSTTEGAWPMWGTLIGI